MDVSIDQVRAYKRVLPLRELHVVKAQLRTASLHSVCEEARCPNRGECFGRGVATFLIGGDVCTRGCRFCGIKTGKPLPLDPQEPQRLADTAATLNLKHVVVTAVNRDDLPDGGAAHFVAVIRALRQRLPNTAVEVLVPDFRGDLAAVAAVTEARPDVFNHNVETVPNLYKHVRPGADYRRSLAVLQAAAKVLPGHVVKSGLMVGHGERLDELKAVCRDLLAYGVNALTVGQYFQPTACELPVQRYWGDDEFLALEAWARVEGFKYAWAGRFVRSSYMADQFLHPRRVGSGAS